MAKKSNVDMKVTRKMTPEQRQTALDAAILQIEKQFGQGAIMKLGQESTLNVDALPTGSLGLDIALGIGGVPKGRIIEVYGPESSGKTTVALEMVAQAQKQGGYAAFIDVEHALDPNYAKALGVNIDELLVSQPDTGEQALEIMEALARSGAVDILVLDSVAAMVTKAEIEGEMGDTHVGVQARLMSAAMRKLTGVISKSDCVAVFINQVREKIGILFGNPEVTPGGRALKFYSSVRIEVRRGETIKDGTTPIGNRCRCKVVKNKIAPPFKEAEFDLLYGKGISYEGEVLDLAVNYGIVKKSGAWFSYEGERLGQGRDKVRDYLCEETELRDKLAELVKEKALAASRAEAEEAAKAEAEQSKEPKAPAVPEDDLFQNAPPAAPNISVDIEPDLSDFE